MLSHVKYISVLTVVLLTSCSYFSGHKSKPTSHSVVQGMVVLKFAQGADEKTIKANLSAFASHELIDEIHKIYLVKDASLNGREHTVADELSRSSGVEFAEPNFIVTNRQHNVLPPQDPLWLSLWAFKNYGQDVPGGIEGVEGADIGALDAWSIHKGDKSVVVAVLDTGIDYTHPDLVENIWVNQKEKGGTPGIDDDGNGYVDDIHGWDAVSDGRNAPHYGQVGDPDPMDDNSHGTHVSGTIGARGGNGKGVVGVNWNVSLMGVKFLDENGSGSSIDEYRALRYILSNPVDVVNGSYGGGDKSKLIEMALKEGLNKGILFVFAAGNDSSNNDLKPQYPASYELDNIISVAATDSRDRIAGFSNFGQKSVHIAAPGVSILSTIPTNQNSTAMPYDSYDGTSMAAPHVSGAAALLIAAQPSLRKNPRLIKEKLLNSVEFKPHLAALVSSGGRLSVVRALKGLEDSRPDLSGQWQSMVYPIVTPAYPREKLDNHWKIEVPEAKALRIHIQFAEVESSFDSATIFDGQYRFVMPISGHLVDDWTPVILGSSAYLKFSNALVAIDAGDPFANFNSGGIIIDRIEYLK